jgi:hypothetical protein
MIEHCNILQWFRTTVDQGVTDTPNLISLPVRLATSTKRRNPAVNICQVVAFPYTADGIVSRFTVYTPNELQPIAPTDIWVSEAPYIVTYLLAVGRAVLAEMELNHQVALDWLDQYEAQIQAGQEMMTTIWAPLDHLSALLGVPPTQHP